jgi:hypothetical protein
MVFSMQRFITATDSSYLPKEPIDIRTGSPLDGFSFSLITVEYRQEFLCVPHRHCLGAIIRADWINTHDTLDSAAEAIHSSRAKKQTGLAMVAAIDSAPDHTNHR